MKKHPALQVISTIVIAFSFFVWFMIVVFNKMMESVN